MKVNAFKRGVMTLVVACTLLAPYAPTARGAQENSLPHLRDGFTRQEVVSSYAAIRDYLRMNNLISQLLAEQKRISPRVQKRTGRVNPSARLVVAG